MESAQCSVQTSDILQRCRQKILDAAPDITDALIQQAQKGSCPHAKFLFDLLETVSGKKQGGEDDLPGPSLAEILLERLRQMQAEVPEPGSESGADA